MAHDEPKNQGEPNRRDDFRQAVEGKEGRKIRARRLRDRSVWSWLGMMGLVGWSVALPAVLGVALGVWMDRRVPAERISWTLSGLVVGAILGSLSAWYWVKRESRRDD